MRAFFSWQQIENCIVVVINPLVKRAKEGAPYRTRIVQYALMKNATCTITVAVVHVAQSVLRIRNGAYFNCANSESVLANMQIAQSETSRRETVYGSIINHISYIQR